MVRALLALFRALVAVLRRAWLYEFVGAALVVWGVYEAWGLAAALVAGGVALLLKSLELDPRGKPS